MARWSWAFVLLLLLIGCKSVSPDQATRRWITWVVPSLVRVQPTDPPGTAVVADIKAARNEYETFQVIVTASSGVDLLGVNVTLSDLVGPSTISNSNITLYREQYVPVRIKSAHVNNGWFAPHPPGDWPDALIPSTVPGRTYQSFPFSVPAGHNQPVLVEVYVPREVPTGTYKGTVTITADGITPVVIPLTLTVWGFTLPDRPALASDFGSYDTSFWIASQYSAGANHDTLKANLYAALQAHRLGLGMAHLDTLTDSLMPKQRFIEVDPDMADGQLATIRKHFITNGWGDLLGVFPVDEPHTQAMYDTINRIAPRFRSLGIPLLATIQNSYAWTAIDGSVDIWAPVFYECIYDAVQLQAKLAKGNRVWSYAAGVQPNDAPTWLLDYDLIHYRIPAWLNYSHSQTGLLYWTTTYWEAGDPWTNAANISPNSGNGEGVLFYPGDKAGAPNAAIPSLRLKALRDGLEDYDYLALLAQLGDPGFAAQLAASLAPAWNNWSRDPNALIAAREQAAVRILELQGK